MYVRVISYKVLFGSQKSAILPVKNSRQHLDLRQMITKFLNQVEVSVREIKSNRFVSEC